MPLNRKRLVLTLIKVTISSGLLAFVVYRINTDVFLELGQRFKLWWFVPLSSLFVAIQVFGSWRWREVLKCHGINQSVGRGMYLYLVGYFYNNFLPTSIGGDVFRGYEASRQLGNLAKIYGSILMERLLGLLATLTIALIFLPLITLPTLVSWLVVLLNAIVWGGFLLFFFAGKKGSIADKIVILLPVKLRNKVLVIVGIQREYRDHKGEITRALGIAFLYQGSLILVPWTGAQLLGIFEVPVSAYMVFVPLIWVISLFPISFNALGIREASFAYFFMLLGSTTEQGFLVSLIFLGTIMLASLVGGALWCVFSYK